MMGWAIMKQIRSDLTRSEFTSSPGPVRPNSFAISRDENKEMIVVGDFSFVFQKICYITIAVHSIPLLSRYCKTHKKPEKLKHDIEMCGHKDIIWAERYHMVIRAHHHCNFSLTKV